MSSSNIFEGADLGAFFEDPYGPYAFARQARLFRNGDAWYAARYEDVDWILKDRRFGKQPPPGTEHRMPGDRPQPAEERNILNTDPPDHTRLRGLVAKAFNANRVAGMRPAVQALVDGLLDDIEPRGSMDIMRDYAYPIPATIISDMLGIPDADRDRFGHLSNEIIRWGTGIEPGVDLETRAARSREAREAFDSYLTALFPAKREAPEDDLTTDLLRAESEEGTPDGGGGDQERASAVPGGARDHGEPDRQRPRGAPPEPGGTGETAGGPGTDAAGRGRVPALRLVGAAAPARGPGTRRSRRPDPGAGRDDHLPARRGQSRPGCVRGRGRPGHRAAFHPVEVLRRAASTSALGRSWPAWRRKWRSGRCSGGFPA